MTDPRSPLGRDGIHPEEALAAFTDGSATPDERATVLQHLQGCARCRREVELARGALAALSSLPEPASPGLDPEVIVGRAGNVAEIDRDRRPEGHRRRIGAIAGGLVAAAVVAATLAGLVRLNGGNSASTASGGSSPILGVAPNVPSPSARVRYGKSSTEYTTQSIDQLAASVAQQGAEHGSAYDRAASTLSSAARDAGRSCTARYLDNGEHLVSVVLARFDGYPAFVAVTRSGTGQNGEVRVVVTAAKTCAVLYATSHPVGG